jgi:iron complex outermembrane receptor protein
LSSAFSQVLSGPVIDSVDNKSVAFAKIYITNVEIGTICDSAGRFNFNTSLPEHKILKISSSFYETKVIHIDEGKEITIYLRPHHVDLEYVISSNLIGGLRRDNALQVDRLDLSELQAISSSNLSEALTNLNGVQMSSSGPGNSRPVVRGFQGMRV